MADGCRSGFSSTSRRTEGESSDRLRPIGRLYCTTPGIGCDSPSPRPRGRRPRIALPATTPDAAAQASAPTMGSIRGPEAQPAVDVEDGAGGIGECACGDRRDGAADILGRPPASGGTSPRAILSS